MYFDKLNNTSVCKKDLDNIKIYPNPTTGELTIELRQAQLPNGELRMNSVEVFDIYGRKLSSHHLIISSSNHLINISHLQAGLYFVKVITEQGEIVMKVIKN